MTKYLLALGVVLVGCADEEANDTRNDLDGDVPADASAVGDAGDGATLDDAAVPATKNFVLCDGSAGVRLSLSTGGGGEVPSYWSFVYANGQRFLHVDGDCNVVVSGLAGQLRTGKLSAQQGETLSASLGLAQASGVLYRSAHGCPDGPTSRLLMPDAYLEDSSCGSTQAPTQIATAFDWTAAFTLADAASRPESGPLALVAVRAEAPIPGATAWPFAFPIAEVVFTPPVDQPYANVPVDGKQLGGAEADLAREMWTNAPDDGGSEHKRVAVTDGDATYLLYFRDELDATWRAMLDSLQRSSQPGGPIARCDASRAVAAKPIDARLHARFASATVPASAPCGVELCWDGSFDESWPVQTRVSLQGPVEPRVCLGTPYLMVSADMQPILDAFRNSYPGSPVEIDLGFGKLAPAP